MCVNIARCAISCRIYTIWCVVEHLHVSNQWPRISHRAYKRHDTPASKKRQNDGRGGHLNCNRLYIYNHLVPIDIQTKKIHHKKKNYNTNGESVMCAHMNQTHPHFRNKKNIYCIWCEYLMWRHESNARQIFETKKWITEYVVNTLCVPAVVKKIPGCWVRCKHLIMAMKKNWWYQFADMLDMVWRMNSATTWIPRGVWMYYDWCAVTKPRRIQIHTARRRELYI